MPHEALKTPAERMATFVRYAETLKGDEKGEAQVFCDRLFQAFGHAGYKEAGAELEFRIKKASGKGVNFADLIWKPRLLLEMKKGGEKLHLHYQQAFDYWLNAVPNRPRYVVLSNFREFWIYDFDKQMNEPVDTVKLADLPHRYTALNFLFPDNPDPLFGNDREEVSKNAAFQIATLFRSLVDRGVLREEAQRFVLQLVVTMFAEDIALMPQGTTIRLIRDCIDKGQSSYDLFGGLFRQMNTKKPAPGGRFKGVPYFNGGLFASIEPIELTKDELLLLGEDRKGAAWQNWAKVNPAIFGTLFQQSMDVGERHTQGAHYTNEADIQRVVGPCIVYPWRERIDAAKSMKELLALRRDLLTFKVLDPACGSGNFLYVAYREMARLEMRIITRLDKEFSWRKIEKKVQASSLISPKQFFGIEIDSFGADLAKVTLMIAKKLALDEAVEVLQRDQIDLPLAADDALPLDNLDANFLQEDALFADWPEADVIIGNPPYQSKNKAQKELGRAYLNKLRSKYPGVEGRADYCVYWFRRAHDELKPRQRAGLVGTNTIRQNFSRISGLDYIVDNGGTIHEAVSTMKWSGDASVDVSVVNWVKGPLSGKKRLYTQKGSDPSTGWSYIDLEIINSSLSTARDVRSAVPLLVNRNSGKCYQGQTHGHDGFLIEASEAEELIEKNASMKDVLFPFLIGNELTGQKDSLPRRYVIDFHPRDLFESQTYKPLYARVQKLVLPDRERAADEEAEANKAAVEENSRARLNKHHQNFLNKWWQLSWPRGEMKSALAGLQRYIVCSRVTLRPIFEFVGSEIRPNDALAVFAFEDDYSFGILQSDVHWNWFVHRCSTQNGRPRYTSETVFDSFPWPQQPSGKQVKEVASAATALRALRLKLKKKHNQSFRELYRALELPGSNPLKTAHLELDAAVRAAYGMPKKVDTLTFLLELNSELAGIEQKKKGQIFGPGLPPEFKGSLTTRDCLHMK